MPYTYETKMVSARLRRLSGEPRFLSLPEGKSWPYCLDKIKSSRVYICEGESDTLTLNFLSIPAIGIPGSTNTEAIKIAFEEANKYGTQLIAVPDNDQAGNKFLERLYKHAYDYHISLELFRVPYGKDINEWYCKASHYEVEETLMSHAQQKDISMAIKPIENELSIIDPFLS